MLLLGLPTAFLSPAGHCISQHNAPQLRPAVSMVAPIPGVDAGAFALLADVAYQGSTYAGDAKCRDAGYGVHAIPVWLSPIRVARSGLRVQ